MGNVSNRVETFKVKMIDTTPTKPVFSTSDGNLASGSSHSTDYTLSWKSTNEGS